MKRGSTQVEVESILPDEIPLIAAKPGESALSAKASAIEAVPPIASAPQPSRPGRGGPPAPAQPTVEQANAAPAAAATGGCICNSGPSPPEPMRKGFAASWSRK